MSARLAGSRWWPWAKRILTVVFFVLVAALLFTQARKIEWDQVYTSIAAYRGATLMTAALLAVASHLLFSSFDLLGRRYAKHALTTLQVMAVAIVSYAFTLNLGSLVGGIGFRFRLYTRLGLDNPTIVRVYTMAVTSNWLGYLFLGGIVFAAGWIHVPPGWKVDTQTLQGIGVALLIAGVAYLAACGWSRKRSWSIRGQEMTLPSLPMALGQLTVSVLNWLSMATTIYILFQQKIEFPMVLGVLLVSAVAGVLTHVPAGIGVLEAVFITLLEQYMPRHELLAGLLAYRAIYYLCPLVFAACLYGGMESRAAKHGAASAGSAGTPAAPHRAHPGSLTP